MADPVIIPVIWDQQALSGEFIANLVDGAQAIADASGKVDRLDVINRLWATARGISPPNSGDDGAINSWTNNRSLLVTIDGTNDMHVSTQDT